MPRKLAWFSRQRMGLYFGVGAPLLGAHTSYHRDGNVFRTSQATQMRPRFSGRQLSLEQFRGWEQFGVAMLLRERVSSLPPVRSRDRRTGNIVCDVPVEAFSSDTLNIVLELVDESSLPLLQTPELQPPVGALVRTMDLGGVTAVLTVLGEDSDLLVRAQPNGFTVSHRNARYTANAAGVTYTWEAYRLDDE